MAWLALPRRARPATGSLLAARDRLDNRLKYTFKVRAGRMRCGLGAGSPHLRATTTDPKSKVTRTRDTRTRTHARGQAHVPRGPVQLRGARKTRGSGMIAREPPRPDAAEVRTVAGRRGVLARVS